MIYSEAIKFLYRLQLFGAKLGLENTRRLAALTGNPHEQLQFIHVAGTNGKGSTCAMLESIYRHAGRRVGLFTSPHLISFRERIQINRELISEVEVEAQVEAMQALFKKLPQGAHPTFFEVVTIMALRYFAAQRCDLVIWETGLGGRLDATNIVTPLVSAITNVDLDHEKWLGQTVEQIAAEKAGIIKPQIPVVTSAREPALTVIRRAATEHNSEVHVVVTEPIKEPPPGLPGSHQGLNAALAEATVRVLQPRIPVSAVAMRDGLKLVSWPGRLQMIRREGQTFLLDGAHNPAAALALREAIEELRPEHPRALVLAIMRDKDCAAICRTLAPLANRIVVCPMSSPRTADPNHLAELCRTANPKAEIVAVKSIEVALSSVAECPAVIITGSLHFVGEALQLLSPTGVPDERELNEWTAGAR